VIGPSRPARGRTRRVAALAAAVLLALVGCADDPGPDPAADPTAATASAPGSTPAPAPESPGPARARGGPTVTTFAGGLEVPWELVFLPDGRALVTERPGRVRLISADGSLRSRPLAVVPASAEGEGGLLGMALDPEFPDPPFVYLCSTTAGGVEVARYRLEEDGLTREAVVLDGIRAGPIHDGGRIAFGPQGRLHVATGDAGTPFLAQDAGSRNGKFLRMEREQYRGDGPGRAQVLTLGHRNPQGFDWQPGSGRLFATEHGQTANDEVNLLREGGNYGWPLVEGSDHGRFTAPLVVYGETIAPSGATFVHLPGSAWTGDLLIAALRGEEIRRLRLDGAAVAGDEALFAGEFGRLRTVVEGPDGALYALTNNRDGRGAPREGDDRILRIVPPAR